MSTPVEHSTLGPSSWDRWIRCPASVRETEKALERFGGREPARYEAAEGTVFHELVSYCLEWGLEPENFRGGYLDQEGFRIYYDDEMFESARIGLEFVRSIEAQPGVELFIEKRVDISPYTLPGQFGTSDVILVNRKQRWVIIFDWKYGKEPVYAFENYQLSGYALGAWTTILSKLFGGDPQGIDVSLIIEQPRVPGAGGEWKTTMTRLLEFGRHAKRQAILTQSANPPYNPGPKQCRWCLGRDSCGALAKWHLENLGLDFDSLDSLIEDGDVPALPEELTPERRSYLLSVRPLINQWFDALHASAYHDAVTTGIVPGMKLVLGRRPSREFAENRLHIAAARLVALLGEGRAFTKKLISPAQAEKALGKRVFERELKRFVVQGEPSPILVPENDRRERIKPAVDLFNDETDEEDDPL